MAVKIDTNEREQLRGMQEFKLGVTVYLKENNLWDKTERKLPSAINNLLQWVAVTRNVKTGELEYIYQYDLEDTKDEDTQKNLNVIYDLEIAKALVAVMLIPRGISIEDVVINNIEPRFMVSMLDGSLFVNGVEYDLRPDSWKRLDPQPDYYFHCYNAKREGFGPDGYAKHIRLYKLGWYAIDPNTEERIERLIFYDTVDNTVEFSKKR